MKNIAILCIFLLACMTVSPSPVILRCKCINTRPIVRVSFIVSVQVHDPRPYCNKQEVIVTMRNRKTFCLDPTQDFTQQILRRTQRRRQKMNNVGLTAPTGPPTVSS
ncbi:C-X-C motif chemokine 3 [Antennarius striatus]|uniref:C-X-C motif chemokine 3 n=1 Tax=Antennarius striatus TaxID=241820 RepID=UPI0035B0E9C3